MKFFQLHRMHHYSFVKLCSLIDPLVRKDNSKSNLGSGPITTELALSCVLLWLAGHHFHSVRIMHGLSSSAFFDCLHRVISAINSLDCLLQPFPSTPHEIEAAARGFKSISSHGVFDGCVAAVDGLLIRLKPPARATVGHVMSFFSGHCKAHGMNLQAACDHECRLIWHEMRLPGGANDVQAHEHSTLKPMVDASPRWRHIVGDNACIPSEHLLTPFNATEKA